MSRACFVNIMAGQDFGGKLVLCLLKYISALISLQLKSYHISTINFCQRNLTAGKKQYLKAVIEAHNHMIYLALCLVVDFEVNSSFTRIPGLVIEVLPSSI